MTKNIFWDKNCKKYLPCPEAKLILALAILGFVTATGVSATAVYVADLYSNDNLSKVLFSLASGVTGSAVGIGTGKLIGNVARLTGLGFFWENSPPTEEEHSALLESKPNFSV